MANTKHDRPPKDLSVPETMKIAALLAELMPPNTLGGSVHDVSLSRLKAESSVESASATRPSTGSETEESKSAPLDKTPPPHSGSAQANLRAASMGGSGQGATRPTPLSESAQGRVRARITATVTGPAGVVVTSPSGEVPPPAPMGDATTSDGKLPSRKSATPLDPELIPLGGLSVGGFFSLVNWNNDASKVKHPRRTDYGLDQTTLTHARRNPFYLVGQPRRPETSTVAEALSEIDWG